MRTGILKVRRLTTCRRRSSAQARHNGMRRTRLRVLGTDFGTHSDFGLGYVGLVTGTCFAELGNDVIGFDTDRERVALLERGGVPIYEPGLAEMIEHNVRASGWSSPRRRTCRAKQRSRVHRGGDAAGE